MVKHIILWTLKDEFSAEEKEQIKKGIKENLEALVGKVPGLVSMLIRTEYLPSSTVEVMLDSTLENEEALKGYRVHPAHVAAANTFVRPFTATRACIDYEIPEGE